MNCLLPGTGLIILILVLVWWFRRTKCRHDISLRNLSAATNAYEVRVSAYTPGAQIVDASAPSTWIQTNNFPINLVWKPVGGGPIPSGNPLPGTFSIWVQNNTQPDKRVLIEWLSIGGKEVICKQLLRVSCGENPDLVPADEPLLDAGTSAACRCLSAETDSDEDSNEFAEPDLSVDVGTPVETAYLQVEVPYTIETEPATLQFTRQWDVTLVDALGDEQSVTVAVADNLMGQATFSLPGPDSYNFYLTITDPATCVSATDRDEDDYTDTDFASFKVAGGEAKWTVKPDLCDPLTYHFTNTSSSEYSVQNWRVDDLDKKVGQPTIFSQTGGNTFDFTFPSLGGHYHVCLLLIPPGGMICVDITPTAIQNVPKFSANYNSCADNFPVQFYNESTAHSCAVQWDWDFGDNTPHSNAYEPQHTYANPGLYTVTLTMTDPTTLQSFVAIQQIVLQPWAPEFTSKICSDGHINFETSVADAQWTFPDGVPPTSDKASVSVCYEKMGPKVVKLYGTNQYGGYCEKVTDLNLPDFSRCCPRDKTREDVEFDYGNKRYRLRTVLRCHGAPHPVVFAKSKLQRFNTKLNKWVRRRAREIRIEVSGQLYIKKDEGGCHCAESHAISGDKSRVNRARITKRVLPQLIMQTRMREGSLVAKYFVRVDDNDTFVDANNDEAPRVTLSLWKNDCACSE